MDEEEGEEEDEKCQEVNELKSFPYLAVIISYCDPAIISAAVGNKY